MTDKELAELQARNAQRAAELIQAMGTKYACHPANVLRKDPRRANFEPIKEGLVIKHATLNFPHIRKAGAQ